MGPRMGKSQNGTPEMKFHYVSDTRASRIFDSARVTIDRARLNFRLD